MAVNSSLLLLLASAAGSLASPVVARDASATSIAPAAATVEADSAAGVDLFPVETIQLTDDVLEIADAQVTDADVLALFGFENSTDRIEATRRARRSGACKVYPGDWNYPITPIWNIFNLLLGGALTKTTPVAAPCYKSSGVYDAAKCADISARFMTEDLHTSDPTSIMWPLFQGRTCMPTTDPSGTCTLGGFPSYSINVKSVAQIQLGVNFARNLNLRLVIKNTGHDYLGKSAGAGALNLWTHNLKDIKFLKNYKSAGYSGPAFKAGAGVQGLEILQAARDNGVTVQAGICETVGWAGGYHAGGGHNPLASIYGMAADNILALEVVTADGRFVTASNTVNSDLFWALRGGGGSTFGVVTSVIVKAFPKIHVTKSVFTFTSDNPENFWKGVSAWFKYLPDFNDAGTYSYFWLSTMPTPSFSLQPFFAPNHTVDSFNALTKPFFDELAALDISVTPTTTYYDNFYAANEGSWGDQLVGATFIRQGSRLFPKSLWETQAKFDNFVNTVKNTAVDFGTVFGFHMAPGNPMNVDNAVNPAWRNTQVFLLSAAMVPENATPAQVKASSDQLTYDILGPWREVAPNSAGGGVYLNEADLMEPNWQDDFYGPANYPKLLAIKAKYDPRDVFYAFTAVGSEKWEVLDGEQGLQTQNGKLCRL